LRFNLRQRLLDQQRRDAVFSESQFKRFQVGNLRFDGSYFFIYGYMAAALAFQHVHHLAGCADLLA